MATLDELIVRAEEQAEKRNRPRIRGLKTHDATGKAPQPLPALPGEPPLVAPVEARHVNLYKRRQLNHMASEERKRTFARELYASGFDQEKAYRAAGYTGKGQRISGYCSSLLKEPVVVDELNRLVAAGRAALDAKAIDLVKMWVDVAEGDVFEFLQQTEDGEVSVRPGIADMPIERRRLIKRISVTKRTEVRKDQTEITTVQTNLELYDRLAALQALGEVQGIFKDKTADAIENFASLLADRLDRQGKRVGRTFENGAVATTQR